MKAIVTKRSEVTKNNNYILTIEVTEKSAFGIKHQGTYNMAVKATEDAAAVGFQTDIDLGSFTIVEREGTDKETGEVFKCKWLQ